MVEKSKQASDHTNAYVEFAVHKFLKRIGKISKPLSS